MQSWKRHSRKKAILVASILIGTSLVVAAGGWFLMRPDKPGYIQNTCSDYNAAVYDPTSPKNLKEFADETPDIVIATVLNPEVFSNPADSEGREPRVRVTEVLKGTRAFKPGDELKLCPNVVLNLSDDVWQTVALFLEGENNGRWIPSRGYIGIIPQNSDGRFTTKMFKESLTTFTAKDLRRIVK